MFDAIYCVSCYQPIASRVIHDNGEPWCDPCRKNLIVGRAKSKADRLVAGDLDNARILAQIQRAA